MAWDGVGIFCCLIDLKKVHCYVKEICSEALWMAARIRTTPLPDKNKTRERSPMLIHISTKQPTKTHRLINQQHLSNI